MLERLVIRNFQKHHKLVVNFDPLVSCIVGVSDVGKSSVLRALRWVCTGHPRGASIIRRGGVPEKKHLGRDPERGTVSGKLGRVCSVRLDVDGHTITASRSKKKTYRLDGRTFAAVGTIVPEEIATLFNIGDITFQRQLDGPFWLGLTAGEVSRALNDVVNLGVIDSTLAAVGSEVSKARAAVDFSRQRLQEAGEVRKELNFVTAMNSRLQEVENISSVLGQSRLKLRTIESLLESHSALTSKLERLGLATSAVSNGLAGLEATQDRLEQKKERLVLLGWYEKTVGAARQEKDRCEREHSEAEKELTKLSKTRCPSCGQRIGSLPSVAQTST